MEQMCLDGKTTPNKKLAAETLTFYYPNKLLRLGYKKNYFKKTSVSFKMERFIKTYPTRFDSLTLKLSVKWVEWVNRVFDLHTEYEK